jgi:hypothetical protein
MTALRLVPATGGFHMRNRLVALVAVAGLAACGDNDDTPPPPPPVIFASCNFGAPAPEGGCLDFAGPLSSSEKTDLEGLCTGYIHGTWSASLCPVVSRSGTCTYVGALGFVQIAEMTAYERFYDAASVAADAANCTANGGSWTPN